MASGFNLGGPVDDSPTEEAALELETASFADNAPQFVRPSEKFAAVFSEPMRHSSSAPQLAISQLIRSMADGTTPTGSLNMPNVCGNCGSHNNFNVESTSSHPDVLHMLRNVLDRLSSIDTRLERVEKIVNTEFYVWYMDLPPVLRLSLVPSSFDPLWFDMRNQLEDPSYLSRLEMEDRKIQGRWRAGNTSPLKIYNRRRNAPNTVGDDSSSSSSSASDVYGGGANDTETGDVHTGAAANAATSGNDQSLLPTATEGTDPPDIADDGEIPTDTWMDDGPGMEAFVADVVSSQMDIASGTTSSSNSDNSS